MLISDGEFIENPNAEKEQEFTLEYKNENLIKEILYINSSERISETIKKDIPLYISLDKDALTEQYAVTDWDQGEMTLDDLERLLYMLSRHKIIGLDICGDTKGGSLLNCNINKKILSFLSNKNA